MKKTTIQILTWLNEFKNEIKKIGNTNKNNNLKMEINILKQEKEHLNQEFNVYIDKLRIKQTKDLKHTTGLTIVINFLILISGIFTVLGFKLQDMAFKLLSDISTGLIGLSLIIGLLLLQWLCFYSESIQTQINDKFGKHIKGLNRIKYILIPISITGTYNFLIDYILFTDNKIINCVMVLMICISLDYSILVFNGIKYDKKHLIFSKETNDIMQDKKSILHMIIFNLIGDKLLKIKLNYINKVSNYNKKLEEENLKLNEINLENKMLEKGNLNLTKINSETKILEEENLNLNNISSETKMLENESLNLLSRNLKFIGGNTVFTTENQKLSEVNTEVSTGISTEVSIENKKLEKGNLNLNKINSETKKLEEVSTENQKLENENKKLDNENLNLNKISLETKKLENENLTLNEKLIVIKNRLDDIEENENISPIKFKGINISKYEWSKIRSTLLNDNLIYILGTSTKKARVKNKKAL